MADTVTEEKIAQLREFTGIGLEAARQLLLATEGNLEEAVLLHFGGGDDGPWPQDQYSGASGSGATGSGGAASSSGAAGSGAAGSSSASGSGACGSGHGGSHFPDDHDGVPVPAHLAARAVHGPRLFTGNETPGFPLSNGKSPVDAAKNGNSEAPPPASEAQVQETPPPPPVAPQESAGWFGSFGRALSSLSQAVMGIASEDFESWFLSHYGEPSPPFNKDCFGDTVAQALTEGKLVLVWFHQEESAATDNMCKQIFQNRMILELALTSFLFWAGDVNRFEPGQIARLLGATIFPTIVVLQPLRHGFDHTFCLEWPLGTFAQPLFRLSPTTQGELLNADQAIAALTTYAQDHTDAILARETQRMQRDQQLAEERRLREEQDREFEESMLMDQLAAIEANEAQVAPSVPPPAQEPPMPVPVASSGGSVDGVGTSQEEIDRMTRELQETKRRYYEQRQREQQLQPGSPLAVPPVSAAPVVAAAPAPAAATGHPVPSPPAVHATTASMGAGGGSATPQESEAQRNARGAEILAETQPEPACHATAKISLKLPGGDRMQRVFRADQTLQEVYDWAHYCRPSPNPPVFELWTNYPAKALNDRMAAVREVGLTPSAALFMKAVE